MSTVRVGIMQAAGVFSIALESDDPAAADAAYCALDEAGLEWPLHATFREKWSAESAMEFVLASIERLAP